MLSWRTARRTSGTSLAIVLLFGTLMPSAAHADGTPVSGGAPGSATTPPSAVKVAKHEIPTRSAPEAGKPHVTPEPGEPAKPTADHVVADLVDTGLNPFSMFGVTWKGGLPDDETIVEARWHHDGEWSDWTELHVDPAPGEGGRPGTEPQWVESADGADVRVLSNSGAHPQDLSLTTVEAEPADGSASPSSTTAAAGTAAVTPVAATSRPAIISRSAWGASSAGSCDSPRYGSTTRGAVIHHTAGSNTYTKAQSAGIVKATQAYHMKGRDWCDIGYNFLVDKYGQIFEGRAGGVDKPVRAAHSGNDAVNQETMGVSLMGTFSTTEPATAMKTAVVNLVSWRFAQYKLPAKGTYSLGGKTLNRIAGHRNVVSTECPGAKAYAWLSASGGLRDRVASQLAGAPASTTPPASDPNRFTVPSSRKVALTGHGYGHGIGMSQYGAQGAAKKGVKYDKILSTYYPGTELGGKVGNIRVLISKDTTDSVIVAGAAGLVFRNVKAGTTVKLPTTISGKTVTRWQITQLSSNKKQSTLQYKTNGSYTTYKSMRWTGDAQFEGPRWISLLMPSGPAMTYRGALRSAVPSSGSTARNTVNVVTIEGYVLGVIAAEMPSSWMPEALKAQAVAARTYGVRSISSSRYYDICDTTSCQVYGGKARETTSTIAAEKATEGKILRYAGAPAFTQFSSSSGGFTATGSQPYLKAVADPYDDWSGNPNHTWTTTVSASTIEKAYPSIGTLKQIKIIRRSGNGDWGGRADRVSLIGSKKTLNIGGDDARWSFGLKSNWFRF